MLMIDLETKIKFYGTQALRRVREFTEDVIAWCIVRKEIEGDKQAFTLKEGLASIAPLLLFYAAYTNLEQGTLISKALYGLTVSQALRGLYGTIVLVRAVVEKLNSYIYYDEQKRELLKIEEFRKQEQVSTPSDVIYQAVQNHPEAESIEEFREQEGDSL